MARTNGRGALFTVAFIAIALGWMLIPQCSGKRAAGGKAPGTAPRASGSEAKAERPFSGPGYVLSFARDFNPGANAVDDLGISVVLAVDVSGSMIDPPKSGGDPKYVQAARALSGIVDFLEGMAKDASMSGMKLKVALITFSAEAQELYPLAVMDPAAFSGLRSAVNSPEALKPQGKTAIGKALELGAQILAESGTVMKSLIVVSDGENTIGEDPANVLWAINENRNSASTADVPVYTRGILASFVGFDVDSGIFAPLAAEGARLQSAADQSGLKSALTDILVADISKLEAAQ